MPVIVVRVMSGRWWCGDQTPHCTHSSADCRAERGTVTTGCGSPDRSPATCTNEATPNHALDGVIWIGASR